MNHLFAEPSTGADFLDTRPPPLPPQHDAQLAELMAALGASTIRAVIFDLDTRLCHESWQVDEYGASSHDSNDSGAITQFVTAMGTIAQLSQTSATETLVRQLNPRRCAFAWRIDEQRVAVAEARYRLPQTGRRDQDAALLRELFIARMQGQTPTEAVAAVGAVPELRAAAHGPAVVSAHRVDGWAPATPTVRVDDTAEHGSAARSESRSSGAGLLALIVFCLVAAAIFLIADHQVQSLHDEQLRLRAQTEATMSRQLTDVLAQGDYGEVQAELQTFAELGYFQDAVVTNAQQRVVALVGTVQGARIGNIFPADASSTLKVAALGGRDQPGVGQLMTWAPGAAVRPITAQRTLLIAGALLSLAALVDAAWLLARYRRRNGLWPGAVLPHPDGASLQRTPP